MAQARGTSVRPITGKRGGKPVRGLQCFEIYPPLLPLLSNAFECASQGEKWGIFAGLVRRNGLGDPASSPAGALTPTKFQRWHSCF